MNDNDRSDGLSREEQEAFSTLSRELQPPAALEDRVVSALRDQGLISSARTIWWRTMPRLAAAAVLILAVGFAAGRVTVSPPPPESRLPRFMLLLYDTPEREVARTPEAERALAEEYGAWAGEIARDGHFLAGDPIHGEGRMLRQIDRRIETFPAADEGAEIVVGYFMIQAEDYDQAVEVARDCPHLKYQGGVLVRRVGEI